MLHAHKPIATARLRASASLGRCSALPMVRALAHSYPRPPELTSRYHIQALLSERCIFDGVAQPHNPRAVSCRASYLRARLTIQRYGPTFKDESTPCRMYSLSSIRRSHMVRGCRSSSRSTPHGEPSNSPGHASTCFISLLAQPAYRLRPRPRMPSHSNPVPTIPHGTMAAGLHNS